MSKLFACLPLVLLLIPGCQKKESKDTGQIHAPEHQQELQERAISAADLGFASRLPESVEFYASVHHPGEIVKTMILADVAEFLFKMEEDEDDPDSIAADLNREELDKIVTTLDEMMVGNAFICVDQGLSTNIETMGELYQNMNAAQIKMLAKMLSRLLKMENPLLAGEDKVMQEFIADALTGVAKVAQDIDDGKLELAMPRLYFGCQPPVGKTEEWRKLWLSSVAGMAEEQEGVEKCEFEKYGTKFQGVKLTLGSLLTNAAEKGGDELQKGLENKLEKEVDDLIDEEVQDALADQGEQWFDQLSAQLEQLTMILVIGEVDGHLVVFLGENPDALMLVDELDDSLASKPEFAQLGEDGGKLMGAWYASDELIQSFQAWRGYEKSLRALAMAFEQEELPNSSQIVRNFNKLADLEHQLLDCKIDDYLMFCVQDQGVRFDSVGGRMDLDLDFSQPLTLPAVAESVQEDYFLQAHWRGNQQRQAMKMDYVELAVGVIGLVIDGGYLAFLERSDEGAEWYEQAHKMYGEIVAPEVARFWGGYRKLSLQALDGEVTVMMDLNGGMPRVPGVPASFVNEGKIPRLMIVRPVEDRVALDEAYSAFATTTENVLSYASIMSETELPMPTFLSSNKGSLTTWFYPFPLMTDDFVPGVSVSDTLLIVGTSKNWAEETYASLKKNDAAVSESEKPYGSLIEIQFKPLWDFADLWLDLAEKEEKLTVSEEADLLENEEAPSDSDLDNEDKEKNEPFDYTQARQMLQRAKFMKSIHWHRRIENESMRSTLEFKTGAR